MIEVGVRGQKVPTRKFCYYKRKISLYCEGCGKKKTCGGAVLDGYCFSLVTQNKDVRTCSLGEHQLALLSCIDAFLPNK